MGNTKPLGMACARSTPRTTSRCGHCGAGLPAPEGTNSSVRCALCRRSTRVERRRRGLQGDDVGALALAATPSPPWAPAPSGRREVPAWYPAASGRKRALLVGVSYSGTGYELKGTVNDVDQMRRLLRDMFGFPTDSFLVLTEESDDPRKVPTKENLLMAMRWLVEGCSAGDSLVFHFSGHGVQKLDTNGDEVDGYNEALCPADFEQSGKILDDDINEAIVRPLGPGVKLHAIVDTCHSGTILDLPFLCRMSRTGYWQWESHAREEMPKGTSGGVAISISGCSDNQKSSESSSGIPESAGSVGAMTDSFIRAVESEPGTTYGRLLSAMRATIRDGQGGGRRLLPGRIGSLVRKMVASSSVQEPQLCSSETFDIYRKPFLL